jgi:hypothetical protein
VSCVQVMTVVAGVSAFGKGNKPVSNSSLARLLVVDSRDSPSSRVEKQDESMGVVPRLWPVLLTSCSTSVSTSASTRPSLSSISRSLPPSPAAAGSSGSSWLMQAVPRRLHPPHFKSAGPENMHRILRRLHSQQLRVPLRTFFLGGPGLLPGELDGWSPEPGRV